MVDVARRAGVSQKTVSRVVNNAPHVRPDVREKVNRAIEELGYLPNVAARALASQRTHTIGVLAAGAADARAGPSALLAGAGGAPARIHLDGHLAAGPVGTVRGQRDQRSSRSWRRGAGASRSRRTSSRSTRSSSADGRWSRVPVRSPASRTRR